MKEQESVKKTENKQKNGSHKLTEPGPGRPKGSTNKFTDLKKAFLAVFEKIEAESEKDIAIDSLFKWATKNSRNQGLFYQMISKMLPSSIVGEQDDKGEFRPLKVIVVNDGDNPN